VNTARTSGETFGMYLSRVGAHAYAGTLYAKATPVVCCDAPDGDYEPLHLICGGARTGDELADTFCISELVAQHVASGTLYRILIKHTAELFGLFALIEDDSWPDILRLCGKSGGCDNG